MAFDWTQYDGSVEWLPERTIFLTKHGSQAYGTNLPTSDLDVRGVCIAPKEYYLGTLHTFHQKEQHQPVDLTVFELKKFFDLAMEANPNVLEILFTRPEDHFIVTPAGQRLLDNRDYFLSKKCKFTFSGYAVSQLKRIRKHKMWLDNPPTHAPTRAEFDLPPQTVIPKEQLEAAMSAVKKQLDSWSIDFLDHLDRDLRILITEKIADYLAEIGVAAEQQFAAAARLVGFTENFIHMLDKERRYNAKLQEWKSYQTWLKERNPARAELERQFGYDTKHGMHLVRLLRMCREILETGEMHVWRPDFLSLLEIRAGSWKFDYLVNWADEENQALNEIMLKSTLRREPNRVKLNELHIDMVEQFNHPMAA